MKALVVLATVTGATLLALAARASCPCYTASSPNNDHQCAIEAVPGINPTPGEWQPIFDLVSHGPSGWGDQGPSLGTISQGCAHPTQKKQVSPTFPCELLKAIAMHESSWRQFCVPTGPADQVGNDSRTIIAFDCGYGIGQVTSGMHVGETPAFDRARVASDPTYNLATGTLILAEKWKMTQCVGDNQPGIVEDWYSATWAYNGLVWGNNPNNPNLDPNRGVYDPNVGGAYAYQERVWGWIENPPSSSYWTAVALAYPDRAACGSSGTPPALAEPSCASPTDCVNHRAAHTSSCLGSGGSGGSAGGGPGGQAGSAGSAGAAPQDAAVDHPDGHGDGEAIDAVALDATGSGSEGGFRYEPGSDDSGCGCHMTGTGRNAAWGAVGIALWILARAVFGRKETQET